jgi:hypothetical protein
MTAGLVIGLAGCGTYRLQGVVLEGATPGVEIVSKNDPRLERFGLPEAELELKLDPERLSPETIARGLTDGGGRFDLAVRESGAGFLIMEVELRVRRDEFRSLRHRFELPGRDRRLIVTLTPGRDPLKLEDDHVLEGTLRDAEPYLRD